MDELNLTELLRYYIKKLPMIILITALVLLVGYIYVEEIQIPMYHGTTTIILVQQKEEAQSVNVTQNELTLNEKLVSTYSQIMKSRRVVEQVISSLNLDTTYNKLKNRVSVTSVSETPIISVTVSDENREKAVKIANELANVFEKEITKIYKLENISVIDEAIVERVPYNVNFTKQMLIYTVAGIALSCGIVFVMYYFDNTIKNKKEIETKLNIAVLGEIPIATKLYAEEKKNRRNKIREEQHIDSSINFDKVDDVTTTEEVKPKTRVRKTKKEKEGEI